MWFNQAIMDYILQLRQYIGHRPILMVGAAILVIDAQNRMLLMKRSDSGCWGPPGGADFEALTPYEVLD